MYQSIIHLIIFSMIVLEAHTCPLECICNEAVDCYRRNLTEIPEKIPNDVVPLLDLRGNMIDSLKPLSVMNLSLLMVLDVSSNLLSKVTPDSFIRTPKLWMLFLTYNQLQDFNMESIQHLKDLRVLALEGNNIQTLDLFWLPDYVEEINVHKNPINCTCHFLHSNPHSIMSNRVYGTCMYPESLRNMSFSEAYWIRNWAGFLNPTSNYFKLYAPVNEGLHTTRGSPSTIDVLDKRHESPTKIMYLSSAGDRLALQHHITFSMVLILAMMHSIISAI